MTELWVATTDGKIERKAIAPIKVRVIKQHGLKICGFFEKAKGLEFDVLIKREGGYDVDLAPLGYPGTRGFMYDDEVEEITCGKTLTIDEIMDRLARICKNNTCGVNIRARFSSGPCKWYVYLPYVAVGHIRTGSFSSSVTRDCDSGATPEEAIRNVWQAVLDMSKSAERALARYNCPPDVPIPGDEPQVWVRWNKTLDDWEDVLVPKLPPEKLRPYKDQIWRDKL